MITNPGTGTRVDEVAPAVYRISTPVSILPGGFSFNQYLVVDEQPLLFHTGPRRMFPLVREAIAAVMPVERLRYVAFSHVEADECGSLNELLAAAPQAEPLCGSIAAMVSVNDLADRPARALADGESREPRRQARALARRAAPPARLGVRLPVRGDDGHALLRRPLHPAGRRARARDHGRHPGAERGDARWRWTTTPMRRTPAALVEKLAATKPKTLACMHGSAWSGDGGRLLLDLANVLSPSANS